MIKLDLLHPKLFLDRLPTGPVNRAETAANRRSIIASSLAGSFSSRAGASNASIPLNLEYPSQ